MEEALNLLDKDPEKKIHMISEESEVSDPWYSGDFDTAYDSIDSACEVILQNLGF